MEEGRELYFESCIRVTLACPESDSGFVSLCGTYQNDIIVLCRYNLVPTATHHNSLIIPEEDLLYS